MLVRFRALSGHRTTLTSSVVASFDTDPMSGYGYGPTLTSSVVADGDCMSIRSLHSRGTNSRQIELGPGKEAPKGLCLA